MANLKGGLPYIRITDLQDPTMAKLNSVLAQIYNAIPDTTSASTWTSFGPTFGGSLTLSAFTSNEVVYQHFNSCLFLNIDVAFTLAGAAASFTIAYPPSYPPASSYAYGDVLNCIVTVAGTVVPVIAFVSNAGVIQVQTASGSNFATGAARVRLTGFYRTTS